MLHLRLSVLGKNSSLLEFSEQLQVVYFQYFTFFLKNMANIYFSLSNEKLLTFLTADDNRKHHDQEKSNNALEHFK